MGEKKRKCLELRRVIKKTLREKFPTYISSVRDWLRKRKTRDELDLEVSSYLQQPLLQVHSEFLLSLSKFCCGRLSLRLDGPRVKPAVAPGDVVDLCNSSRAGQLVVDLSTDSGADHQADPYLLYKRVYTDREICPVELIKARLYLAAWDHGLCSVDSKVTGALYWAMRTYIKDLIHAVIVHRGKKNPVRISALDIWHAVVRTNCDLPAVPHSSGPNPFRSRDQENRAL